MALGDIILYASTLNTMKVQKELKFLQLEVLDRTICDNQVNGRRPFKITNKISKDNVPLKEWDQSSFMTFNFIVHKMTEFIDRLERAVCLH